MSTDDRSTPLSGQPYSTPPGGQANPGSDELYDAAERLERASWDQMQDEAGEHGASTTGVGEERPGAILTFLERQLNDRPLPTLLLAVAAGWLAGKLLR